MKKRRSYSRSGSLKVEDWVEAARAAMAEGGVGAVAVEPLARRLGVTKGSFYWHFKDRRALLETTLERWEEESTEARISAGRRIPDPRERLVRLGEEVFGDVPLGGDESGRLLLDRGVELAISDAADDDVVRPFLRRVTEHRIGYLEDIFRELGLPTEEARHRAIVIYAAHAGTLKLLRDAPDLMPRGKAYKAYRRHLLSTFLPEDEAG